LPTALYRHRRRLYISITSSSISASPTARYRHRRRVYVGIADGFISARPHVGSISGPSRTCLMGSTRPRTAGTPRLWACAKGHAVGDADVEHMCVRASDGCHAWAPRLQFNCLTALGRSRPGGKVDMLACTCAGQRWFCLM
jgi:hypothetical protein